jgi:hypothetical protein
MKAQLKEWNDKDFNKVNKALEKYFGGETLINHRNEAVYFPRNFFEIEKILGLPYTSTSCCPMLALDCNVNIDTKEKPGYHYSYVFISEAGHVVLVSMDKKENEFFKIVYFNRSKTNLPE